MNFFVKAIWDDGARVFRSESNISGLHIEAETLDEFESVLFDSAGELIVANHLSAKDIAENRIADLIPTVFWERPAHPSAVAAE